MNKNIKAIIREVPPEESDFSICFDCDCFREAGGDYCYNLFIVAQSRNVVGFNEKEYKRAYDEIELLVDEWDSYKYARENGLEPNYNNFSDIVAWNAHESRGGLYAQSLKNTHRLNKLRKFIEWLYEPSQRYGHKNRVNWEADEESCVAEYLSIATGKDWDVDTATGYCQGDCVRLVYCKEHYKSGAKHYGEIWLGAAKEFAVIYLDENGEESWSCYGFIVADSEAFEDEDYKKILCERIGIKEDDARLEMIENSMTFTTYSYRAA